MIWAIKSAFDFAKALFLSLFLTYFMDKGIIIVLLFFKNAEINLKEYSMNWLIDLFTNPYLITALSSWALAQVIKMIIYAVVNKKFDIHRLFGDGGMPSGHSATVTSLAIITGLINGLGSAEFGIAMILAVVVCHDAMGVRQEAGKQAVVLNELIDLFSLPLDSELRQIRLKEFVGHTPVQVLAGIFVGFVNAIVMYCIFT